MISAAGANLDMYSIHPYPYFNLPSSMSATLSSPQTFWPTIMSGIRNAFNAYANGRQAPIAVTEFNLVSASSQDNNQWMTRAVNMLFLADSIGQAAQNGAAMFAQWDLANGRDNNGTEYGLMHEDNNYYRAPQYYVYPLWSRFGSYMLPVTSTASPATELSVYAGWVNSTTVSLLAVNKTNRPVTATITVSGFGPLIGGVAYEVKANSLMAQSVTYNGSANPSDNLSEPPASFSASGHSVTRVLPAYSVVLLHLYQDPPPPHHAQSVCAHHPALAEPLELAGVFVAVNAARFNLWDELAHHRERLGAQKGYRHRHHAVVDRGRAGELIHVRRQADHAIGRRLLVLPFEAVFQRGDLHQAVSRQDRPAAALA